MEDFTKELVAGNVKAAMREAGAVSADLWQVAPSQLRVIEGFNVRSNNEKFKARVRKIADSIHANGFYKDKPISGFVAKEDGVDVIFVTGGHTRHAAVDLAISEGADIAVIPVIVKPKGTSMEDLTVDLIVGNDGEPLSVYEQAVVCKRLAGFGWDSKEIARRVGYASAQYVDSLLNLAAAPLALRKMVIEEVVSATTAMDALKKHGDKAVDVLLAAVVKAGTGRATAKHLPEAAFKKTIKKQAEPMYTALTKVQEDPAFIMLGSEVQKLLADILAQVKK